jgi:hypothetical protein
VGKAFISYSGDNKADVRQLADHLEKLGWEAWFDSSLHGGQDWWQVILHQIQVCDVFIPIISAEALDSIACAREFDWAEALGRPVCPVAFEPRWTGLPRRYETAQSVDYSDPAPAARAQAAINLAAALFALPKAPPIPDPLPAAPAAPLSYLTELDYQVAQPENLNQEQQREVLKKLEPALRSFDPKERQGGRRILDRFSGRDDLYADVDKRINELRQLNDEASRRNLAESGGGVGTRLGEPTRSKNPKDADGGAEEGSEHDFRNADLGLPAVLLAAAAIAGVIPPIVTLSTYYDYPIEIWFCQDVSRILIGIAFFVLAVKAESFSNYLMVSGYLMTAISILHLFDHLIAYAQRGSQNAVYTIANVYAYPVLVGLASVVAIVFGWRVFRDERLAWAALLTAWGGCGLVYAALAYFARTVPSTAPAADSVLIMQNMILLTVAIVMYRESRADFLAAASRRMTKSS